MAGCRACSRGYGLRCAISYIRDRSEKTKNDFIRHVKTFTAVHPTGNLSVAKAFTVVLTDTFGYLPSQVTFIRIRTCAAFRRCFFEGRTGFRQTPADREATALVLPRAGVFVIFYAEQWDNDVPSTSRAYSIGTVFQAMFPNV
jgi:hypothetical protein